MKSRLVLVAALLGLIAPKTTLAQGVYISWGGCPNAGSGDNAFGCNSNATLHHLVSSFTAHGGITNFVGATTEVLLNSYAPLGPWWALQAGGCRAGALSSEDPSALALGDCSTATFDGSQNLGLANYEPSYNGNPNQARITVDMARSDGGVPLDPGVTYQANVIQIRSTKTTGTGACDGCTQGLCLFALRVFIAEPDVAFERNGNGAFASWRTIGCITPTRRHSWGEVKSLYR